MSKKLILAASLCVAATIISACNPLSAGKNAVKDAIKPPSASSSTTAPSASATPAASGGALGSGAASGSSTPAASGGAAGTAKPGTSPAASVVQGGDFATQDAAGFSISYPKTWSSFGRDGTLLFATNAKNGATTKSDTIMSFDMPKTLVNISALSFLPDSAISAFIEKITKAKIIKVDKNAKIDGKGAIMLTFEAGTENTPSRGVIFPVNTESGGVYLQLKVHDGATAADTDKTIAEFEAMVKSIKLK